MSKPRSAPVALALALAALALLIPAPTVLAADPGLQELSRDTRTLDGAAGTHAGARAAAMRTLTPCTWSYFGDPRSIARRNWVFTGCISTDGRVSR